MFRTGWETDEAVTLVPREGVRQLTAEHIGNVPRDDVKYSATATGTTVAKPVGDGEARLPGIAKNSATTAFLGVVLTVAKHVADGEARLPGIAKNSATTAFLGVVLTVAKSVGDAEARPPEFAKDSAATESKVAVSSGGVGPSWPRAKSTPSAGVAAAARCAGEARPPGIAKQSAPTESDIAGSSGEAGPLGPKQMAGTVPPLQ